MGVYKQKGSKNWWYKFHWNGRQIRETSKQTNKRVAEQMEAAHRTSLAKGEVGIRDKKPVATIREFIEQDFRPYIESRFVEKPKTREYYRTGIKHILAFAPLASCPLDAVTADKIGAFISDHRARNLKVSTINRLLEVLRRIFSLATEWEKLNGRKPKVSKLSGEYRRDRVLGDDEEARYLASARQVGEDIEADYQKALHGIRATMRGEVPIKPEDPYLLLDVATILIDCGLRPEECFRMRWEDVRKGALHVLFGKTANARRRIPLTERVIARLEARRTKAKNRWVFPAPTASGHIEKFTVKKQHKRACALAQLEALPLYTFRHTCLTRWAEVMDPYTLAYLAGHSDFSTTRRYVHPRTETVLAAFERASASKGGHNFGHSEPQKHQEGAGSKSLTIFDFNGLDGRGEWIRTTDLLVPNQAL